MSGPGVVAVLLPGCSFLDKSDAESDSFLNAANASALRKTALSTALSINGLLNGFAIVSLS
jgi:hypothetical protein